MEGTCFFRKRRFQLELNQLNKIFSSKYEFDKFTRNSIRNQSGSSTNIFTLLNELNIERERIKLEYPLLNDNCKRMDRKVWETWFNLCYGFPKQCLWSFTEGLGEKPCSPHNTHTLHICTLLTPRTQNDFSSSIPFKYGFLELVSISPNTWLRSNQLFSIYIRNAFRSFHLCITLVHKLC